MINKSKRLICSVLVAAMAFNMGTVSTASEKSKDQNINIAGVAATTGSGASVATGGGTDVATGSGTDVAPTTTGQSADVQTGPLSRTSINAMANKSVKLTISGISGMPMFTVDDQSIASVEKVENSADYTSATATIKLLLPGETVIRVAASGEEYTCSVRVVPAMDKVDFGMYEAVNFVDLCTKKKWDFGWRGEWKKRTKDFKYGSTYRGIKIGRPLSAVERAYGDLNLKKCNKKKDPFLYEVKFNKGKKLVVKNYADLVYGKYCIRVYFTKDKTVFGFILVKNIKMIKKSWLKTANGGRLKMI